MVCGRIAFAACGGRDEPGGIVRTAEDARTLVLDDGRRILLDGVVVPQGFDRASLARSDTVAAQARRWLEKFKHQPVTLAYARGADRHGRIPALVISRTAGLEASLQHDMVFQGLAFAAPFGLGTACAAELFARERAAREAGRGLWADPDNAVLSADDPQAIRQALGRMAVVEGRVRSVRESGGTIYVNFGRRWSQDFTVTIAKRNEGVFASGGLPPKRLERRQVRVRGWIEERGGPWIEAFDPEQFEIVGPQGVQTFR